ncbi:homeobox protein box-5-like [Colius striatus]|uniref:homeobox protein box-5-like n=1 Tax=Colius striatus TaxID=57412 RepID=UPI002B1E2593|nr:homeobox protein box-5-like [Colius striatus]
MTMAGSLLGPDSSKASFLELGHPSLLHYPLHGLHPTGHPQHDPPPFASYGRPWPYPYPGGAPLPAHGGPYLPYPPPGTQHPPARPAHRARMQDAEHEKPPAIANRELCINRKGKKLRKPHTIYSILQLQVLNQHFQQTQYLTLLDHAKLTTQLGLTQTQVKIWIQNKCSKYKKYKYMKQGSSVPNGEHLHTTTSLSPCSSNIPLLWDIPMPGKGAPLAPSSYIISFRAWYKLHLQDTIPQAPMM